MPVIPATSETEIQRIRDWVQPGPKFHETPFPPIKSGHGGMCHPNQAASINRRIMFCVNLV
jgi:hypothetical protein